MNQFNPFRWSYYKIISLLKLDVIMRNHTDLIIKLTLIVIFTLHYKTASSSSRILTLNPLLLNCPGSNCEVDINECDSDPCLYGECQDSIAKYICLCNPGYEGINCDEEINECERHSPCQYGTCTGKNNSRYIVMNSVVNIWGHFRPHRGLRLHLRSRLRR